MHTIYACALPMLQQQRSVSTIENLHCVTTIATTPSIQQVLRQTQGLKEALVVSDSQVVSLQGQVEQLKAEVEQCRRKAETDQEQVCAGLLFANFRARSLLTGA